MRGFICGVVVGFLVGLFSLILLFSEELDGSFSTHEHEQKITECELTLPRNKNFVLVAIPNDE